MALRSRLRGGGLSLAVLALVALGLVAVNIVVDRAAPTVDLTAGGRLSLSRETRAALAQVDEELTIDAFVRRESPSGRDASSLARRYRDANSRIKLTVVDPDAEPGRAERLGVTRFGSAVLQYQGRRIDIETISERHLTSAIVRLVRGKIPLVCAVAGHGEADIDDEGPRGLSSFRDLAERNGFGLERRAIAIDGLEGCDLVLIAGARVPFAESESDAVVEYLRADGKAMILADALSETDLNPIMSEFGIRFLGGVVLDPSRNFNNDASTPILTEFPSANPVVADVPSVVAPAASGLLVEDEAPREGLHVSTLAVTSDEAVLAADPEDPSQGGLAGPILVAAAADESAVRGEPPVIHRTRLLVVADVVFATNAMFPALGNSKLLANGLSWLADDELLLTVGTGEADDRPLAITPGRRRSVFATTVVGVPLLVLIGGAANFILRRRR